jgi:hydrogenase expression/formation protein HypC
MCLAVPGQVMSVEGSDPMLRTGRVSFGGIIREASLAFVPEAGEQSWVLVHAGVAIGVVDEAEARRMLETLESLEEPELPEV